MKVIESNKIYILILNNKIININKYKLNNNRLIIILSHV